jgi:hypothetical protein
VLLRQPRPALLPRPWHAAAHLPVLRHAVSGWPGRSPQGRRRSPLKQPERGRLRPPPLGLRELQHARRHRHRYGLGGVPSGRIARAPGPDSVRRQLPRGRVGRRGGRRVRDPARERVAGPRADGTWLVLRLLEGGEDVRVVLCEVPAADPPDRWPGDLSAAEPQPGRQPGLPGPQVWAHGVWRPVGGEQGSGCAVH